MPWPSYAALELEDVNALVAYLRALPPVEALRIEPVTEPAKAIAPFYRVMLP